MGSVGKKGRRWYAVIWERRTKTRRWELLPADVTGKRAARRAMQILQDADDRQSSGLPMRSSTGSLVSWGRFAASILAEIEIRNGRQWYLPTRGMVRRLSRIMGNKPIQEVTVGMCRAYEIERLTEIGDRTKETLRKEIMLFRRIWRRAIEERAVVVDPWKSLTLPKRAPRSPKFMTVSQFGDLIRVASPEWAFRWKFLVQTGARLIEAVSVRWSQVDFQSRVIRLRNAGKGKGTREEFRTILLSGELIAELRKRRGNQEGLVFSNIGEWTKQFTVDRRAAGIPSMQAKNMLRHTFASWLAQSGQVTLLELRDLLGHGDIGSTQVYAILIPAQNAAVALVLAENCRRSVEERCDVESIKVG